MSSLQSYRRRAFAFPLLGAVYVAVALLPAPAGSQEIFPFFNWSLFSVSSNQKLDAVVRIHSINGTTFSEPVSFYKMPDHFSAARARDALFMKLVDQLALAIIRNDEQKTQAARDLVEQHFMREAMSVEYEVAVVTYHPIERYKEGKLRSIEVLARYTKK